MSQVGIQDINFSSISHNMNNVYFFRYQIVLCFFV